MEQPSETKLKAFVRIRPAFPSEGEKVVRQEGSSETRIKVINPDSRAVDKTFRYDHVFGEDAGQEDLHKRIIPDMINSFVDGLNTCLFAYGQTGSGKTYSIMGEQDAVGLLPRFCKTLFHEMGYFLDDGFARIEVAFFEVYNEKVYDLLADERIELKVRGTDPPQPENLTYYRIQSINDFDTAIQLGLSNRSTAATKINELSSRSHAIFQIKLAQTRANEVDLVENLLKGKLTLCESNAFFVDLAGSERVNHGDSDRSEEGIAINKALLALGNVIKQRARGDKFIAAIRDSLLTRLLKPCFSEDARTFLLATISPLADFLPFTVKTLEFAENASRIKQNAKRHYRTVNTPLASSKGQQIDTIIPPLTDFSNIPYSRKKYLKWYTEVSKQCPPMDSMEIDAGTDTMSGGSGGGLFSDIPDFQIGGPDDLEGIQQIREFFLAQAAKRKGIQESLEQNSQLFEAKLKQRLCTADLDRQKVVELEEELRKLKTEHSAQTGQIRQLKRENDALRVRLYNYESRDEKERRREEGQRYLDAERDAAFKSNRRTLQKVAELFESPIPTQSNVARLRKKFGSNDDLESMESGSGNSGGNQLRKMPKMTTSTEDHPSTPKKPRVDGANTIKFYDATNTSTHRSPHSKGFVNPRYQRRSRSAGNTSRVLSHQPVTKIPTGTVYQPKLPKSTKYTSQVNADDLKKHDEYMVTRQEVDSHGNVKTKLFKGEVIPTAGGGTAVQFMDVENLEQKAPYDE